MNRYKAGSRITLILFIACILCITPALGLKNPAAVYAEALGYEYQVIDEQGSGVQGIVLLPDGSKVPGWDFLMGKTGEEFSACAKYGGKLQTIQDKQVCSAIYSDTCAVCELPNGTRVEVTVLLNLDFSESVCGDGVCGMPENEKTCPKDCPKDGMDDYCGGGTNDPDCIGEEKWTPDINE